MARMSGGGGGSHHSSGGGGGHHSGGGYHSSSSRMSSSHSSSSRPSASHSSTHHTTTHHTDHYYHEEHHYGGPRPHGPRPGGPRPSYRPTSGGYRSTYEPTEPRKKSAAERLIGIFAVILVMMIIVVFLSTAGSSDIASSTKDRERLDASNIVETEYYDDRAGCIENASKLESGMRDFYKETGVQPYLYIAHDINGNYLPSESEAYEFGEELYAELFDDEAHFLYIYIESEEMGNAGYDYFDYYIVGHEARLVLDDEAIIIFRDYVRANYCNEQKYSTYDRLFSDAFSESASRMMEVTINPWIYVFAIAGVGAIVIIGFSWWEKMRIAKKEEEAETEKILNTPLEKYDDPASELAKKYESEDTNKSQGETGN